MTSEEKKEYQIADANRHYYNGQERVMKPLRMNKKKKLLKIGFIEWINKLKSPKNEEMQCLKNKKKPSDQKIENAKKRKRYVT